jgi:hypothetical protein
VTADGTGVGPVDGLVVWAGAAVAIAGLFLLLWRVLRALLRIAGRLDDMWEDWHGTPEVPARPGVMVRLGAAEGRLDAHEARLTRVETHTGLAPGVTDGRTALLSRNHVVTPRTGVRISVSIVIMLMKINNERNQEISCERYLP